VFPENQAKTQLKEIWQEFGSVQISKQDASEAQKTIFSPN